MKTPAAIERFRERLLSLPAEDLATLVVMAAIALDDLEMPEDIAGQLGSEEVALSEWEARVLHAALSGQHSMTWLPRYVATPMNSPQKPLFHSEPYV